MSTKASEEEAHHDESDITDEFIDDVGVMAAAVYEVNRFLHDIYLLIDYRKAINRDTFPGKLLRCRCYSVRMFYSRERRR